MAPRLPLDILEKERLSSRRFLLLLMASQRFVTRPLSSRVRLES